MLYVDIASASLPTGTVALVGSTAPTWTTSQEICDEAFVVILYCTTVYIRSIKMMSETQMMETQKDG